jgi:predicted dehydrogenase
MVSPHPDPSRRQFIAGVGASVVAMSVSMARQPATQLAPPEKQPPDLDVPGDSQRKAGWAVVGLGTLALNEVLPAFSQCARSRLVALVSGHPDKAKQTAEHYGLDQRSLYTYDNFDTIGDSREVDIVYICLPDSLHAEYTIRAARAGKHVLCEKPMARSVEECRKMIDAARAAQRKLMIAYRLRYEPFNQACIEMCTKRAYGQIKTIEATNLQNVEAPNIRLSRKTGTGPIGDVGVYCINACRYLTSEDPIEVTAFAHQPKDDPRFADFPESYVFTLRFGSGILANCACSFGGHQSRRYRVNCADGWIDLDPAFSYSGQQLHVAHRNRRSEIKLPHVNHFVSEMDHFSRCVLNSESPWTPGEEGLADLKVIEAINRAVESGKAEKV